MVSANSPIWTRLTAPFALLPFLSGSLYFSQVLLLRGKNESLVNLGLLVTAGLLFIIRGVITGPVPSCFLPSLTPRQSFDQEYVFSVLFQGKVKWQGHI